MLGVFDGITMLLYLRLILDTRIMKNIKEHLDCVFCNIVERKTKAHIIWEDEKHMAFLSIFPNTLGLSVVIPKKHYPSDAFQLTDEALTDLVIAAKIVGNILTNKLKGVGRTALVFEGFGINHVHAKLFPMHGTENIKKWQPVLSKKAIFFNQYEGYISTHDCERANDEKLEKLADYIKS